MSYLGKSYTFEKSENFDQFLASLGVPKAGIDAILSEKPVETLEKNGDTYTLTTSKQKIIFQSGVEVDETIGGRKCKVTFVVDGNTVTQTQKHTEGFTITFKRQYSGNKLVVEVTNTIWDGVAHTYYSA